MTTLTIHVYVAFAVAALAVLAVWRRPERRITLSTLQIVVGVVADGPWRACPVRPALAVLGWIGYTAANAIARRDAASRNAVLLSALSSLLILVAYYVGMQTGKIG